MLHMAYEVQTNGVIHGVSQHSRSRRLGKVFCVACCLSTTTTTTTMRLNIVVLHALSKVFSIVMISQFFVPFYEVYSYLHHDPIPLVVGMEAQEDCE